MAPSFDCAVSTLLCAEGSDGVFDDADSAATNDNMGGTWPPRIQDQNISGALPAYGDDCLALMFKESQHLAGEDYFNRLRSGVLDLNGRMEVVDWIGKVSAYYHFGPLCAYLSVNYLDRFLSAYELPEGKAWLMRLLAVACVSIAAKMEEVEIPTCVELQVEADGSGIVFEPKAVQRMELLVLRTLEWRMQAVTPFSFLDCFLSKVNYYKRLSKTAVTHSASLILSTLKGIDFVEFRPSEIAAAVAISVAGEINEDAVSALARYVRKEKMLKCVEMINMFVKGIAWPVPSVPHSPIGVLETARLSFKSDDSTTGSWANSPSNCKNNHINEDQGTEIPKG